MDLEYRLRKLEMQYLEVSERLANVEDLLKSHIYYSSLGGTNYCNNNAQSKSTNRFSVEDFSMISKRLAKVEKQLQNKRENAVTNTHGVPIVGKENNFGGAVSLSSKKTYNMSLNGKPAGPLKSSQLTCNSEPQPLMEFPTTLVTHHVNPSASYTKGAFFKKFREILNKLNSGNVEKLYQEFLISVGPDDTFPELATFIFSKAINEVDSPTSPTCYAQLMARACNNVNMKNLSVELRKASMDHFSELFDVNEAPSSSSEFQHGDISTSRRRSKGILRFIGELFKVDIIPFEDMKNFVDCLLLHPEESNLNHLCNLLKLTGSLLETKSNAIESGIAANLNSNHTHMPRWFAGVCAELERKKDYFNNRTKFAIMDILELRDGKWTVQEPPNIENFLEPPKESGGGSTLWRETQQSSISGRGIGISCTPQQYTLFPVSSDYDNMHMSLLNSSSQPMTYNQVVRKSINVNVDTLELCASSPSIGACSPQIHTTDLKMQPLSQSQLSLIRSGNSRSPSITASLDEGTSSSKTRNRRRNRRSKKLRDKTTDPDPDIIAGSIVIPTTTTNNGF